MSNFTKICRTCLITDQSLLSVSAALDEPLRIAECFRLHLNMKVSESDELPPNICIACLEKLLQVRKFHLQCMESENYLRNKLAKKPTNILDLINEGAPLADAAQFEASLCFESIDVTSPSSQLAFSELSKVLKQENALDISPSSDEERDVGSAAERAENAFPSIKVENIDDSEDEEREKDETGEGCSSPHQTKNTGTNENNFSRNEEIFSFLKTLIENQKNIHSRISTLENLFNENVLPKHKFPAQNKFVRQNMVIPKQVLKTTRRLYQKSTDEIELEIAARLPLTSIAEISDLEDRIQDQEYKNNFKTYLLKLRGTSNLDDVFRRVIVDQCVNEYNWDGRSGKRALRKLKIFDDILFDIFKNKGRKCFEQEIKKSVELSRNRYKQRKRKLALLKENI